VAESDLQPFCWIYTLLTETCTTKIILISFLQDWPNSLTTCKSLFSPQCALGMRDFTGPSNICNSSRKIHPILHFCLRISLLSKQFDNFSVSELVKKARQSFRQSKGINQENYVFVIAPGETSK
jgi:hypothetical protein